MASILSVWPLLALIYAVFRVLANERKTEFEQLVTLDGKICDQSATLFTQRSPSLLACCSICASNASCASLFYKSANSSCVGCSRIYMSDSGLNSINGTKYLYDPKLVATTISSTSTSTTSATSTSTSTTTTSTTTSTTSSTSTTTTRLTTTSLATATTSPDSDWKYNNGHLYKLDHEVADYDTAVNKCRSQQAELAHIESETENDFIGQMVADEENGNYKVFIGATDRATEGDWRWEDDNSQLTYHKWRGGSAHTNGQQDCLGMVQDANGDFEWMDVYCSMDRKFVCKK